jgi:hypothetical protein
MNRAPRELIDDLQAALIAEHQARQASREATHRGVEVMLKLREAGVPWMLIARHAAQILGRPVSEVGRLAATLRQRAWSVTRPHKIRAGASTWTRIRMRPTTRRRGAGSRGARGRPVPRSRGSGYTACVSQDGAGQVYGVKLSVTTQSEESASRLTNA